MYASPGPLGGVAQRLDDGLYCRCGTLADQPQIASQILDKRRAALDPVAVVAIEKPVALADVSLVDVAAHDSVEPALGGRAQRCALELHALVEQRNGATVARAL